VTINKPKQAEANPGLGSIIGAAVKFKDSIVV
jgi:hypothetical protein